MTFTATTWTTTSVSRVKADYVAIYTERDGSEVAVDANMVLTQLDESSGGRRTVLGVIDTRTCEVIAATDMPGYRELASIYEWRLRRRPTRITNNPTPGHEPGSN